ncbi:tubulin polyglutamylase TTLL4 isoform X2 [Coturnix japonica]|uniref:tubulin polyglutamylase TTLL4 isoform X2 n=1 Tax=Coturnix japonica TaxID=93934 RepID=UPI000777D216|nr:tubulin polyglutamylase TTLL4 isoform X2 [Coturnix japonica]
MASAGPQHNNLGPRQEESFGLRTEPPPAEREQQRQVWCLTPQQQAKPIWTLEGQHMDAHQDRIPLPSGILLQQSCFLYPPSPCPSHPSESAQPCPELCGSTLLYQRSCLKAKPYHFPFQTSQDTSSVPGRAMSSLLMEPFLPPALPEEHAGSGLKGSARCLGSACPQQASSSCRPVLHSHSFLQPSSAKVPLLQSPGVKKLKNTPSFPIITWPHSKADGDCFFRSPAVQSSDQEQTSISSLTLVPSSVTLRNKQCSWPLGDADRKVHSLCEAEPKISLTAAVQQLVGQTATCSGFGHEVKSSGLRNAGTLSNRDRSGHHITAQLTPEETIAPLNLEMGSHCLNGDSSLIGTDGAVVCTKRVSVHLQASRASSPSLSSNCQLTGTTTLHSSEQGAGAEPPQLAAISEVATQMSSIQLEEKEKCAYAVLPKKPKKRFECLSQPTEDQEKVLKPALVCSLFPNVLPTIYFSTRDERVEKLPLEQRKLLRWKMCAVTPDIVKETIKRSHFKVSEKSYDWLGCWGQHMKSPGFRAIREHQKLNHFPGSFQIGRKDCLWRNLLKMRTRCGKKEFNFFPQSFILPQDIKLLRKAWKEGANHQRWIVKPPASARGVGIQVIHKWNQLPKRRPLLVQRYLHKPYLIDGRKFDLRIYVYVTCYDPLRVYMFEDGLVRFASCKYSSSMKSLSNKFVHLTNYSVNKKNAKYKSNLDETATACQGHKWSLKALWNYLKQKGVNSEAIWEKIKDIVIKTIIASEPYVNSLMKMYVRRPYCCHELFGFDIMLDENLKPWILEVNISPSLHSSSPLDVSIKGQMIRDLLNLAGFVLPSADSVALSPDSTCSRGNALKGKTRPRSECFTAEKLKKAYYLTQKVPDQDFYSSVLDFLTPDDVRILVETEDEYSRRGQFQRVFPTHISMRYLHFFEQPRYFNILVTQWELKYYLNKHKVVVAKVLLPPEKQRSIKWLQ